MALDKNTQQIVDQIVNWLQSFTLIKVLKVFFSILLFFAVFTSYYTVEPDEEAVIIRMGRYYQTTSPGLHFKLPFGLDQKILVKTTKIHQAEFGFRTAESSSEQRTKYSQDNFDNESLMLTGDLNVGDVEWVVQYKISDPYKYLFQASQPIQNIRDVSESIMRRVVGDRLVNEVLTTGRADIENEAKELMQQVIDKYDIGIFITAVKLQDVNPPEMVKSSFNEVNKAKQEQEKLINEAEEAYNKVIPEARGKAEELISRAEGFASAYINRAIGDAERFNNMYQEYKLSPSITKKRLYLETMEELFLRFEKMTIVDSSIKGLLPIFQEKGKINE